jgi:hypothetical protein
MVPVRIVVITDVLRTAVVVAPVWTWIALRARAIWSGPRPTITASPRYRVIRSTTTGIVFCTRPSKVWCSGSARPKIRSQEGRFEGACRTVCGTESVKEGRWRWRCNGRRGGGETGPVWSKQSGRRSFCGSVLCIACSTDSAKQ